MEKHPSKQPEHISSFVAENNGIDVLPSTSSPSSDDDDVSFFDNLPPGYVFIPTDEEIIGYLRKKVNNESMPRNRIRDVELYKWDPWDLTEKHKLHRSDKGWYYLTPRERKYKNGDRPARATKSGYYKATGKATDIYVAGEKVGSKRSLVFHVGKSPNGDKSDWVMQEYKLKYPEGTKGRERQGKDDMLVRQFLILNNFYSIV
ncbi:NAC domain containing protein [Parasponia andersonii]|uniref:NAC domain containing protein n=1 Tax=Parasponia andersonii TaxID=3476 RepID=A0A2P5C4M6_PARAD|nr:NAC domain containing protein [Parasponia andersonii]